jgi:hypothetical protein
MTEDERKQVEADSEEDLELDDSESGEVRGGDGTTATHIPGRLKWQDTQLKRGITDG